MTRLWYVSIELTSSNLAYTKHTSYFHRPSLEWTTYYIQNHWWISQSQNWLKKTLQQISNYTFASFNLTHTKHLTSPSREKWQRWVFEPASYNFKDSTQHPPKTWFEYQPLIILFTSYTWAALICKFHRLTIAIRWQADSSIRENATLETEAEDPFLLPHSNIKDE